LYFLNHENEKKNTKINRYLIELDKSVLKKLKHFSICELPNVWLLQIVPWDFDCYLRPYRSSIIIAETLPVVTSKTKQSQ